MLSVHTSQLSVVSRKLVKKSRDDSVSGGLSCQESYPSSAEALMRQYSVTCKRPALSSTNLSNEQTDKND